MTDSNGKTIEVGMRVKLLKRPKVGTVFKIDPAAKDGVLVADAWPKFRWASWCRPGDVEIVK